MTVKVFITIDTEEDNWGSFSTNNNSVDNIDKLLVLQSLFDKYNAIPTYLINYPVATTPSSIKILSEFLERGVCEIGTHCHPWNTPPFSEELNEKNSMMSNLPYDLLIAKMCNLHDAIKINFKTCPVSFRAGRWGFSNDVARCLSELEYKIDTSISPFVDWASYHGPNFRGSDTHPYFFDVKNITQVLTDGEILEVPPSIGFFQPNHMLCDALFNTLKKPLFSKFRLIGLLDKLNMLNFRWLSPELSNGDEMVKLAKQFVKLDHKFLNMSFHSTSLLPGKSPFVQNEKDLTEFLYKIEVFLKYAVDNNFEFAPISAATKFM